MAKRMRAILVESFVGAIVTGWVLAEGLLRFVGIFTMPLLSWASEYQVPRPGSLLPQRPFPYAIALPDAISSALLLLIGYALLRWLYYEPASGDAANGAGHEIS